MPVSCCCKNKYLLARFCPSPGSVSTVGMSVADAAIIGSLAFKLSGTCYYFDFSDTPTTTIPGTLTTPGAVTTFADCTSCLFPPETCTSATNPRYRISGYVDGDLTTTAGVVCGPVGGFSCSGNPNPIAWDGSFHPTVFAQCSLSSGVETCNWITRCDNTDTGTPVDNNQCISGTRAGSTTILQRVCTVATNLSVKTMSIFYVSAAGPTTTLLWGGTASTTDAEMATTYTRTGGVDLTASFTLEHY